MTVCSSGDFFPELSYADKGPDSIIFVDGDPEPDVSTSALVQNRSGQRSHMFAAGRLASCNLVEYLSQNSEGLTVISIEEQ
jgi:hypothetical protein